MFERARAFLDALFAKVHTSRRIKDIVFLTSNSTRHVENEVLTTVAFDKRIARCPSGTVDSTRCVGYRAFAVFFVVFFAAARFFFGAFAPLDNTITRLPSNAITIC